MPFQTEPPYTHGQAERTAVLLCNLGTPDEPTASAVRRYLSDFLGDHRVVEIPRLVWWPILHGIILRTRPAKSAEKYASVWTPEGSPLAVWTAKQATLLRGWLGQAGHNVLVRHAMRYGNPSIASQLDALKADFWNTVPDGKRRRCAEVLIYPRVSPAHIVAAICNNVALADEMAGVAKVKVEVNPSMFF